MATWLRTIRLPEFHAAGLTFLARRDAIVARLRASRWPEANLTVAELVDELAQAGDEEEFDDAWDALYDEADAARRSEALKTKFRSDIEAVWKKP